MGTRNSEDFEFFCNLIFFSQFLNAFWEDFAKDEAEKLWHFVDHCVKIDQRREAGTELDELEAHRFLEKVRESERESESSFLEE